MGGSLLPTRFYVPFNMVIQEVSAPIGRDFHLCCLDDSRPAQGQEASWRDYSLQIPQYIVLASI